MSNTTPGARCEKDGRADACILRFLWQVMLMHVQKRLRSPCKIRYPMRGHGCRARALVFFYHVCGLILSHVQKVRKIRCPMRGRGCRTHVCLCFTVFAALYGEPCSESLVKYGAHCAASKAIAWMPVFYSSSSTRSSSSISSTRVALVVAVVVVAVVVAVVVVAVAAVIVAVTVVVAVVVVVVVVGVLVGVTVAVPVAVAIRAVVVVVVVVVPVADSKKRLHIVWTFEPMRDFEDCLDVESNWMQHRNIGSSHVNKIRIQGM